MVSFSPGVCKCETSAGTATDPISACLTHVGYSQRLTVNFQPRGLELYPPLPGCSSLSFLAQVRMPTEPCLSAPCLTHSQAMVMWHGHCSPECLAFHLCGPDVLTLCVAPGRPKGCDIYKAQSSHFRSHPHESISIFLLLANVLTHTDSIMKCKCNSVNLQAAPEFQADLHHPVKEDNN